MKIEIINEGQEYATQIPVQVINFSGGEVHVKVDTSRWEAVIGDNPIIRLHQEIRNSADFMTVVMAKDAIDELVRYQPGVRVELYALYVPYARQDRYCEQGEAFGVRAFANLLNSLNFSRVKIADPHSDVTPAVVRNLDVLHQHDIAFHMLAWKLKMENFALVAPDGGALKKIFKLGTKMGLEVHCADKIRDTKTGQIIRTDIPVKDFEGQNLMIIDDICDGGRTFLELAKVLRQRNAGKIELYVTHGIFSAGVDVFEGLIDCVHSFNVWENNVQDRNTKGLLVINQKEVQKQLLFK